MGWPIDRHTDSPLDSPYGLVGRPMDMPSMDSRAMERPMERHMDR